MTPAVLTELATRMHLLLRTELGQGIDAKRMLDDRLYARDVLLVCDALPDGALLAQEFRTLRAAAEALAQRTAAQAAHAADAQWRRAMYSAHGAVRRSSSPPSAT